MRGPARRLPRRPGRLGPAAGAARRGDRRRRGRARPGRRRGPGAAPARGACWSGRRPSRAARCAAPRRSLLGIGDRARADAGAAGRRHRRRRLPGLLRRHRAARAARASERARPHAEAGRRRALAIAGARRRRWRWRRCWPSWWSCSPAPRASRRARRQPCRRRAATAREALCDRPLNEVAFAGTHNSFSAADSPGWFIANQRHTIPRQLEDGIRLFLIDPHWGVELDERDRCSPTSTTESARPQQGRQGAAAGRAGRRRAPGGPPAGRRPPSEGDPDVWLCHTVCELGATRMADVLEAMREFLEANPGEVVILFIEPYVKPSDIAKRFEERRARQATWRRCRATSRCPRSGSWSTRTSA